VGTVMLAALADEFGFANSAAFQRAIKCRAESVSGAYLRPNHRAASSNRPTRT
jgi:hypothetical protein